MKNDAIIKAMMMKNYKIIGVRTKVGNIGETDWYCVMEIIIP